MAGSFSMRASETTSTTRTTPLLIPLMHSLTTIILTSPSATQCGGGAAATRARGRRRWRRPSAGPPESSGTRLPRSLIARLLSSLPLPLMSTRAACTGTCPWTDDLVVPPVQDKAGASKRQRRLSYAVSAFDEELARLGDDTFFGRLAEFADPLNGAFDHQPSPRKPPLRAAKIDHHLAWASCVLWEPSRQECVAEQVARQVFKTGWV
ncbi:hypothetical protein T484DRAFT_3629404 [Baffinella frigidus]|nr:hypothetical protein T484DRAFT_3629404 [Cryptophyta sp. CCMP2293]